ncbi:ABC transporter substrate-binding protein [Desulfonatronovibrio hydrogenovorans]|uniref:ABC transporter substrate-binding protein n=1 Tax=Desulfonatronovibrio hydrogenovorans TaxID=53245 RepID=UPI0005561131|nr:ABC transporter substrate-binding protein [Desulfonatronovibrio hydrogenovorans]
MFDKAFFAKLTLIFLAFGFGLIPVNPALADQPLVVVSPWKANSLDPSNSGFVFTRMGCLETLVTSDRQGGITPMLATEWSTSPDGLTWSFYLRENVKFHDGTPLNALAASRALNHALDKGAFQGVDIEKIQPAGDLVLTVKTRSPFSALPSFLANFSAAIGAPAMYDQDFDRVIGTGMYEFVSHRGLTDFEFRAFADYWGDPAQIARAQYRAIPNGETRALMAESGEAHLSLTLSPESSARLDGLRGITMYSTALPRVRLIKLNCSLPLFNDPGVRRAMSMAIDRPAIAASLLDNPDIASTQLLPRVSAWHNQDLGVPEHFAFNPEMASQLLEQAGWTRGSDGIRTKDGQRFSFEIITYASRPTLPLVAQAIQAQFKEVGIEMRIVTTEAGIIPQRHNDNTLEAAFLARNYGQIPDAIATILADFGPADRRGGWGAMGWESDEFYSLLNDYMNEFDSQKGRDIGWKISEILNTDLPVIPVAWYDDHVAVSGKIKGFNQDPFELRPYPEGVHFQQ